MRHGEVWWAHLPKPVGRRPVDDLTTIPTSCIKRRIVMLSADKMRRIEHAIRFALDLP